MPSSQPVPKNSPLQLCWEGDRGQVTKRFAYIWFPYLKTDWLLIRNPQLKDIPIVLTLPDHGRKIITSLNALAEKQGIHTGAVLADAKAICPWLKSFDDRTELSEKLLRALGEWCIRFTPIVAVDLPDGIILDATGCTNLWHGEVEYLQEISKRLFQFGYKVRLAMADTIGSAWAMARYGEKKIVEKNDQYQSLLDLHPSALRLDITILEKFYKLGFHRIKNLIDLPRSVLLRRFGGELLKRIDQALGNVEEFIEPIRPTDLLIERLSCLEPIVTATGIEIALKQNLEKLCARLNKLGKGIRKTCFKAYRIDGKMEKIEIGVSRSTINVIHLFKLFELKIESIEPGLGIELFELEALQIEDLNPVQEKIWETSGTLDDIGISEFIDRLKNKFDNISIERYLPDEHHWPERSFKKANSLLEKKTTEWPTDKLRPIHLFQKPEPILVTAPIPDYPPMLFRYKNKLHKIKKADGPERIEREWWIEEGPHRDYYCVEDEEGCRFWLFRSGHYGDENKQWFLHGIFA